ncbi:hypothetical protein [Thiomicrospira sp. WB1]|uniref:P-II family nitrogen regulator n=1 Tax=Thiomicrospira sp. WB1 TaxID=1685380 RepID=UPI00074B1E5E|nr:hypothetical protein [Thiomicrospira sp. WB1]KUJ71489.1 hypothetical protein AVO41_08170 [Thiomicrospira sp. WB1]
MTIPTCSEKMLQVIASTGLERRIKRILSETGVSGYTLFDVRGDGETGFHSSEIEGDGNVMFMIILPESKIEPVFEKLEVFEKQGHHLMVFASDVSVMTRSKFA